MEPEQTTTPALPGVLRALLDGLCRAASADGAALIAFTREGAAVREVSPDALIAHAPTLANAARVWRATLRSATLAREGYHIAPDEANGLAQGADLIAVRAAAGAIVGCVALVGARTRFDGVDTFAPWIMLAGAYLDNQQLQHELTESRRAAQSLFISARAIAESESPQHIISALHDQLCGPHVSSCAMLFFGSTSDDGGDYLEIAGSWSKRVGEGVGIGVRLYLSRYRAILRELNAQKILTFDRVNALKHQFDPLLRGFLRAERVRSLVLVLLQSGDRPVGVMAIATDKPHDFTPSELHSYQMVAEFLTIHTVARIERQERDRVQKGRAALLDAVTDAVLMVLPQGRGGRVLTLNQRFTRLFEVEEASASGLALSSLLSKMALPEEARRELRRAWLSTPLRTPSISRGEFHMIDPEGRPLEIGWYSAPVYQEASLVGRIYTFTDISADRAAARMRAAFLSRVSHELRTPLTSIHGFAEFILEMTGGQLPDLAREYIEIILSSAKHLNAVFTDIIEISRADAGQLTLNKRQDANLPDVVIDVVARAELQYKARGQRVIMTLDDDQPTVPMDVERITQVLNNLIGNAIKYSPQGGRIWIETHLVDTIDALPPASPHDLMLPAVLVTVRDEGKGLSQADAEQVFLPFYRTADAKRNKIEGVGLGLAVTRSIVEMHRGKIWAETREQAGGGCFRFTLPMAR